MSSPVIVALAADSAGARAGLRIGDEIARVDGIAPSDVIEWRLATDEADIELEVRRDGLAFDVTVPKRAGEPLGVDVQSAVFDRVRTCDNHCEFCFIYQLPKGMRRSLYLKDDDYRLSFLYGNFTTLTRFTEADLERVVVERLSPLHVSIHAVDHDTRNRMLKNERGGMSLRWLRAMLDHGIDVRGQIVVCPGVNDGDVLDATMAGVLDRFPELSSVAVVPLGLSKYNTEPAMRLHTPDEANRVVDLVEHWQSTFVEVLGRRVVFAADEYYLMADRDFPAVDAYEGFALHEDGIGMARAFEQSFNGVSVLEPRRDGFFAAVDLPANPAAYTGFRAEPHDAEHDAEQDGGAYVEAVTTPVALLPRRTAPIAVLSSRMGARVISPLIEKWGRNNTERDVRVVEVDNEFFGGNTGVAGLMTGADLGRVLRDQPTGHRYLIPDVCVSDDGRFLDGMTVGELPQPVEVVGTDGAALRRALERAA